MYRRQGLLVEVDGLGTPDEVFERIWQAFAERESAARRLPRSQHAELARSGKNSVSSNFGACALLRHVCTHYPRMTMRTKPCS